MPLCYRDRSFCSAADCATTSCHRYVTPELEREAAEFGLPLSKMNFSLKCEQFVQRVCVDT